MRSLNNKKIIIVFLLAIVLDFFVVTQDTLATNISDTGLGDTAREGYGSDGIPFENEGLSVIIGKVVGAGLAFIGVLFFILMIYGGLTWMMARGNEQDVTKAKELIQAAVIGLIIVLAAYAITAYIGDVLVGGSPPPTS